MPSWELTLTTIWKLTVTSQALEKAGSEMVGGDWCDHGGLHILQPNPGWRAGQLLPSEHSFGCSPSKGAVVNASVVVPCNERVSGDKCRDGLKNSLHAKSAVTAFGNRQGCQNLSSRQLSSKSPFEHDEFPQIPSTTVKNGLRLSLSLEELPLIGL